MNFMLTFFVVLITHIVFDLIEKIESLHNDMDMLLQSHQESLSDMEQIKEAAERKKIIIFIAFTVDLKENKT